LKKLLEAFFLADFYESVVGKIIYLPIFDKTGVDFRINYLEKITEKKIDTKLLEETLHLTGGHSSLVQLSAEALLASDQKFEDKLALRKFLLEQKTIRNTLASIWNYLTPSEQNNFARNKKTKSHT
jgi:hypothetical protein